MDAIVVHGSVPSASILGFAGLGNYSLCVAFQAAKCSADELNIVPAIPSEDIVSRVRERATGLVLLLLCRSMAGSMSVCTVQT